MTFEGFMTVLFEVLAFFGLVFCLVLLVRLVLWCLECSFFSSSSNNNNNGKRSHQNDYQRWTLRDGNRSEIVDGSKAKQNKPTNKDNEKTQVNIPSPPTESTKASPKPKAKEADNVLPLQTRQEKQQNQTDSQNIVIDIETGNLAKDGDKVDNADTESMQSKNVLMKEKVETIEKLMIIEMPALQRSQTLDENVSVYDNVSHRDSVQSEPVSHEERLRVSLCVLNMLLKQSNRQSL